MSFASQLTETVTLERQTVASRDTSGGIVQAWSTVATGIACQVNTSPGGQQLVHGALQQVVSYTIFTSYAEAQNGDRVLLSDGTYVRITHIHSYLAAGSLETYFEWSGMEVKP